MSVFSLFLISPSFHSQMHPGLDNMASEPSRPACTRVEHMTREEAATPIGFTRKPVLLLV